MLVGGGEAHSQVAIRLVGISASLPGLRPQVLNPTRFPSNNPLIIGVITLFPTVQLYLIIKETPNKKGKRVLLGYLAHTLHPKP